MRRASVFAIIILILSFVPAAAAQGNSNPRPKVKLPETTPFQQSLQRRANGLIEKERTNPNNPDCQAALDEPDDPNQPGKKAKNVARKCKVPHINNRKLERGPECPDCGEITKGGKKIGHKISTKTLLEYEEPAQRGKLKWADVAFPGRIAQALAGAPADPGNSAKTRSAGAFSGSANNDDKDCRDTVTGEVLGGLTDGAPPPDGAEDSCYDANGELKQTLTEIEGGCQHASGATFIGDKTDGILDDCYDERNQLRTTLEEFIDEDGPESVDNDGDGAFGEDPPDGVNNDGDCVDARGKIYASCSGNLEEQGLVALIDEDGPDATDNDGDGEVNEDPAPTSIENTCRNFGMAEHGFDEPLGEPTLDGQGCGLQKAFIVAANKKSESLGLGKAFDADEHGNCNTEPTTTGGNPNEKPKACGSERRRVALVEDYTLTCPEGAEYVDGECLVPTDSGQMLAAAFMVEGLDAAANGALEPLPPPFTTATMKKKAMMGFTLAPPVLAWGFKVQEEACVDLLFTEFCFEVFYARLGYEFDFAVGLRLPVEVTVENVPSPLAPAHLSQTMITGIEPLDFSVGDYEDFCTTHNMADGFWIANCQRFAFPDFFTQMFPPSDPRTGDGSEFVAHAVAFAGLQVRVLSIPLINWGIDFDIDLPTLCTFLQLQDEKVNPLAFALAAIDAGGNVFAALKESLANCASFKTPYGFMDDPINPMVKRLRAFPASKSFDIPADCASALIKGPSITIKGKKRPICTGIIAGIHGASLGVGLGIQFAVGSTRIDAGWSLEGDASGTGGTLEFGETLHPDQTVTVAKPELGPVSFDNYSDTTDSAQVVVNDFVFYINALEIQIRANLEFGGILDMIPDIDSFTLYAVTLQLPAGMSPRLWQHNATKPLKFPVFVENHALSLDATPAPGPDRVNEHTLRIQPGQFGTFNVNVDNLGSVRDTMTNFKFQLSNRPDQASPPYQYGINLNTDFDCLYNGQRYFGNPYDGVADGCWGADGVLLTGRVEARDEDNFGPEGGTVAQRDQDGDGFADEDPPDEWRTNPLAGAFLVQKIENVDAHGENAGPITLQVSPFRHPLTRPGLYPVEISADSQTAYERRDFLPASDPRGNARRGAKDVVFVEVKAFFDPQMAVTPKTFAAKPGVARSYVVEGANGGNDPDTIALTTNFLNFNTAACTLTTMGSLPGTGGAAGCPYRATVTQIPAGVWTDVGTLGPQFGPLEPLFSVSDTFTILVPADWAGMQDTTYEFQITGTSTADPNTPAAKRTVKVKQTVVATSESMTRYIALEIAEMIQVLQTANANGIATAGLLPVQLHPVQLTNQRALDAIMGGNWRREAARTRQTCASWRDSCTRWEASCRRS